MTVLMVWSLVWLLGAGSAALVLVAAWHGWRTVVRRRRRPASVALPPIAPEFLRIQARVGQLKRLATDGRDSAAADAAAARDPASIEDVDQPHRSPVLGWLMRGGAGVVGWLGWPGVLIGLLAVGGLLGGLLWQAQRHPPLPPQAQQMSESINEGFGRVTSYRIAASVDVVRAFYQRELPKRGWRYCGTQATPGCTNLVRAGNEDAIAVYRRAEDDRLTGLTVEVWVRPDATGQTFVTVFETRLRR